MAAHGQGLLPPRRSTGPTIPTSSSGCRCATAAGAARRSTSSSIGPGRTARSSCSPRPAGATSSSGSRRGPPSRPDRTSPCRRPAPPGQQLEIIVDVHERYPWTFGHQQATTRPAQRCRPATTPSSSTVASSPRSSASRSPIWSSTMTAGKLRYLLADLATVPNAAVVVEDRYSAVFKLDRVRPAVDRRGPRRGGGPLPVRADRVRRDPTAGPGVDLPLPRRRARPPPR